MSQVGNFGDSSNEQLRQEVEALPLPTYFEIRTRDEELQACQRYFEKSMTQEKAWGQGLEDTGDSKLVIGRVVPATTPYPKTLGEAVGLKPIDLPLPTVQPSMTPYTKTSLKGKLEGLAKTIREKYEYLDIFPGQALAISMLSSLEVEVKNIINELEGN